MSRCRQFYEKLERDGNFCGMSEKVFRRAMIYLEYCEKNNIEPGTMTEGEWRRKVKHGKKVLSPPGDRNDEELSAEPIEGKTVSAEPTDSETQKDKKGETCDLGDSACFSCIAKTMPKGATISNTGIVKMLLEAIELFRYIGSKEKTLTILAENIKTWKKTLGGETKWK